MVKNPQAVQIWIISTAGLSGFVLEDGWLLFIAVARFLRTSCSTRYKAFFSKEMMLLLLPSMIRDWLHVTSGILVGFAISNGIEEALTLNLSLPHTRQLMTSG
jgi:hypothetical protein